MEARENIVIKIKIGRHNYEIDSSDKFMDNGACVQLLSQSKEKSDWSARPNPVLPKRVVKEISSFSRVQKDHIYGDRVQVFSLDI
jgi:hypothetical protein